jgi:hypothetical protein
MPNESSDAILARIDERLIKHGEKLDDIRGWQIQHQDWHTKANGRPSHDAQLGILWTEHQQREDREEGNETMFRHTIIRRAVEGLINLAVIVIGIVIGANITGLF